MCKAVSVEALLSNRCGREGERTDSALAATTRPNTNQSNLMILLYLARWHPDNTLMSKHILHA